MDRLGEPDLANINIVENFERYRDEIVMTIFQDCLQILKRFLYEELRNQYAAKNTSYVAAGLSHMLPSGLNNMAT